MPPSPQPVELRFLTEPPSETQAYPLHALPSRNGASICPGVPLSCWGCRELPLELWRRVLGSSGTACPTDKTTDSPWHLGGGMSLSHPEVHLSVLTHSQPRCLCLLIQHSWVQRCGQTLNHHPWAEGDTKGSGERGKVTFLGHSSCSPKLPSLYKLRPLGNGSSP